MICELLLIGEGNGQSGRMLAGYLQCDIRDVTQAVERERRQGKPICATSNGKQPGYFLAANADELQYYCNRLKHRERELRKTRKALLKTLEGIKNQGGTE